MARAQPVPDFPTDRPPLTSPTAIPPRTAPPRSQPTVDMADDRRPVAVIVLTPDPRAEELADQLNNTLVNHVDLKALPRNDKLSALKGAFADEDASALESARRARAQCEELLVGLDYPTAERTAREGMDALLRVRPTSDVLGLYAELAFDSGQALLRQRKPNEASLAFGLSFRLDPARRPDPGRYEPDIVEAYQLASARPPVTARLEVKGTGTVWIDGVDRGPPGTFDVASGLHVVQLAGEARDTRGREVAVPQTIAVELEAAPSSELRRVERARIALAQTRDAAARAGAVKKLAALLAVEDAVLIERGEDGLLRVQTWRDRVGGFSPRIEYRNDPAVDLLTPLAPPRKVEPRADVVIPQPPPRTDETPWWRTRWAKGGGVVVVIGLAALTYWAATQTHLMDWDSNIGEAQ